MQKMITQPMITSLLQRVITGGIMQIPTLKLRLHNLPGRNLKPVPQYPGYQRDENDEDEDRKDDVPNRYKTP
ncbi:hypothetical protein E2C01_047749 [Portunus trituberculatus]|uniref:Uncharacterized protein n=1 Tax=Portunus trituberculatus TaxID=210409 RepID=A0A5B7G8L0_PORTR|nr:hypothetical protein [Portunus trituberculatus]